MRCNDAQTWSLAIDTSCRIGSVSLGRGDTCVESRTLADPMRNARRARNSVELIPVIANLCDSHDLQPSDLAEIYVAVGPGSFTGLRIAIATAKIIAQVHQARLIAVPAVDVIAEQAAGTAIEAGAGGLAVCVNYKRGTAYTGLFSLDEKTLDPVGPPALMTIDEILDRGSIPIAIVGEKLPVIEAEAGEVVILDEKLAQSQSQTVWRIGRRMAAAGQFVDYLKLAPLYVRPPEAVELWDQRHGKESKV